jgi:hypothetical protein
VIVAPTQGVALLTDLPLDITLPTRSAGTTDATEIGHNFIPIPAPMACRKTTAGVVHHRQVQQAPVPNRHGFGSLACSSSSSSHSTGRVLTTTSARLMALPSPPTDGCFSASTRDFTWRFVVADVTQSLIGADLLSHFSLLMDCRNNRLVDGVTVCSCPSRQLADPQRESHQWRSTPSLSFRTSPAPLESSARCAPTPSTTFRLHQPASHLPTTSTGP